VIERNVWHRNSGSYGWFALPASLSENAQFLVILNTIAMGHNLEVKTIIIPHLYRRTFTYLTNREVLIIFMVETSTEDSEFLSHH
jgi:hypothetical protein